MNATAQRSLLLLLTALLGALAACMADTAPPASHETAQTPETRAAAALARLRADATPAGAAESLIAPSPAARFEHVPDGLRPRFLDGADPARALRVEATLGADLAAGFALRDLSSGMRVHVAPLGAPDAAVDTIGGDAIYGAGDPVEVAHRPSQDGVEDFWRFEAQPAREELRYRVELGDAVAGLRLAHDDVLELLDADGYVRLRARAPHAVASDGALIPLAMRVEGCAVDRSLGVPWERPVTDPGARACTLVVAWSAQPDAYPLVVDPAWEDGATLPSIAQLTYQRPMRYSGDNVFIPGRSANMVWNPSGGGSVATTGAPTQDHAVNPGNDNTAVLAQSGYADVGNGTIMALTSKNGGIECFNLPPVGPATCSWAEVWSPGSGTFSVVHYIKIGFGQGKILTRLSDGRIFALGEVNNGSFANVMIWNPSSGLSHIDPMELVSAPSLVALSGSRVLVRGSIGGVGVAYQLWNGSPSRSHTSTINLGSADLVAVGERVLTTAVNGSVSDNRAAEVWTTAGVEPGPAANLPNDLTWRSASSAVLPDGRVLLANDYLSRTFLWDPSNDTIDPAGSLPLPHSGTRAVALSDGRVLLIVRDLTYIWDANADDRGASCASDWACSSFSCESGACCDRLCEATSESCRTERTGLDDFACGPVRDGIVCNSGEECGSGFCVDRRCCDTACDQPGQGCAETRTGVADGTCAATLDGIPCDDNDGCGSGFCADGVCCDTACDATDDFCNGRDNGAEVGVCAPTLNGSQCNDDGYCGSGFCTDGFCCDTRCGALGERCDGQHLPGVDPGTCGVVAPGSPCGEDADCASGTCEAGVCCDTGCDQPGESCLAVRTGLDNGVCGASLDGVPCGSGQDCGSGFCSEQVCCAAACAGVDESCRQRDTGQDNGVCAPVTGDGVRCDNPDQCDGGHCVGGLCCDAACDGPGQSCRFEDTGATTGLCGPVLDGVLCTNGDQCGSGFCADGVCCNTACDGDGEACVERLTGTPDGACTPVILGSTCGTGADCASGVCVEGVCCDDACEGGCRSCRGRNTGGEDGNCQPITRGEDPFSDCAVLGEGLCQTEGFCDGDGQCESKAGDACGAPSECVSSRTLRLTDACTDTGACEETGTIDCAPYACADGACLDACGNDNDCIAPNRCLGGVCREGLSQGQTCGAPEECASGFCVDGVCCESGCSGTCLSCTGNVTGSADGLCRPVAAGQLDPQRRCEVSDDVCGADGTCDGEGTCTRFRPEGEACGRPACENASVQTRTCDGFGRCEASSRSCGTYACEDSDCLTTCINDTQCASGNRCNPSTGQCVVATAACIDDETLRAANGDVISCAPGRCINDQCSDLPDANNGNTDPDAGGGDDDSPATTRVSSEKSCGCRAIARPASPRGDWAWASLLGGLVLAALRRRRRAP